MNKVLQTHVLDLVILNSYLDFNDYATPIKSYLADSQYFPLVPNVMSGREYRIQFNEAHLNEDILFNFGTKVINFYSIGERNDQIDNFYLHRNCYAGIYFRLAQEYDLYERSVFTFFDMLGILGGIYRLLSLFGRYVVAAVARKILYNTLLSELYHVEAPKEIDEKKIDNQADTLKPTKTGQPSCTGFRSNCDEQAPESEESKEVSPSKINIYQEGLDDNRGAYERELLSEALNEMKQRRKYVYSLLHILYSFVG